MTFSQHPYLHQNVIDFVPHSKGHDHQAHHPDRREAAEHE